MSWLYAPFDLVLFHAKSTPQRSEPIYRPLSQSRSTASIPCQFLQQHRSIHNIHPTVLPIPQGNVVKLFALALYAGFHKVYRLLEFVEVFLEDGVVEGGDELGEIGYV